jgi:chaperonin GroEL
MIEKQLHYDNEAQDLLLNGVNKMADAVKSTLGAAGKTVIIEDDFGRPHPTKDGVSVARSITLSDPVENLGASILRQASVKTADLAGDGTTTTVVMAQRMIQTAFFEIQNVEKANVTKVRNILQDLSKEAITMLEKKSRIVTDDTLRDVATISANNDTELGGIIADAYKKVGVDGAVTIEESSTGETYTTIVEGTKIRRGYHSPYMITDKEKNLAILENPVVLVSDKKISTLEDIEALLEVAIKNKRPILIIADVDTAVMNLLNVNKAKGVLKVNVIAPEGVGLNRYELLDDLALMTGATLVSDETGNDFSAVDGGFLGFAKKAQSTDKETVITLDMETTADAVKERAAMVRKILEERKDEANNWHYKDRLARLSGGVAAINVGAFTEVEMKEKKDRVEDAIFATRAALEEGIVAGGGIALLNVANKLYSKHVKENNAIEFDIALMSIVAALKAPALQIVRNDDYDKYVFLAELEKRGNRSNLGYNIKTGRYGDMYRMGIIDPLKVVKNAIKNSTSVVMTLLTTTCVVSNKRA